MGITGSGKTKTALEVAKNWQDEQKSKKRHCVIVNSFTEVQKRMKNVCVVLDDCFSRWTLEKPGNSLSEFLVSIAKAVSSKQNVNVIITLDSILFKRHQTMLQHYDVFNENHIINISDRHQLSESEKQQILGKYLMQNHCHNTEKHEKETISESSSNDIPPTSDQVMKMGSKHSNAVGYPSTCVMFSTIPEFRQQGKQFFKYCDLRIGNELANKIKDTADAVCCIFYAMLQDRIIDLKHIDMDIMEPLWKMFNIKDHSEKALSKNNDWSAINLF